MAMGSHAFVIEGIPPDRWAAPGYSFTHAVDGIVFCHWGAWGASRQVYGKTFTEAEILAVEGVTDLERAA